MATDDFKPTTTSSNETRRFDKELQKDVRDYHLPENEWVHARNAINNSISGDLGRLGNEPANKECIRVWQVPDSNNPLLGTGPLTIIGMVHIESDKWAVFSTDDTDSEIGYFEGDICRYSRIVNDRCLNFKKSNLITGQSREAFDCNYVLYWADGLNPDRYMEIGDITYAPYPSPWPGVPYLCSNNVPAPAPGCVTGPPAPSDPVAPCLVCIPTLPLTLNCDKIRLESLMRPLKLQIEQDPAGGNLLNGSYIACGAYSVNGQRVTDYFTPSNIVGIFNHDQASGSVQIQVVSADTDYFDEFELVIVSIISQQTVAKKVGTYSTKQRRISYDVIDKALPSVPLEELPVINTIYEKSDAMFKVNDYLLRVGPTSRFQFNYQPLANLIRTKWAVVEYSEGYYEKGGVNTGYLRDEVYSFFIRWVYNTGDKSASFHIPGRPKIIGRELNNQGANIDASLTDLDSIEVGLECGTGLGTTSNPYEIWEAQNTAYADINPPPPTGSNIPALPYPTCDGGVVIEEGFMGYWESVERYPDNKPEIWNSSSHTWSCLNSNTVLPYIGAANNAAYDLCGKQIRHHKFPDNDLTANTSHFRNSTTAPSALSQTKVNHIRVMGVKFENIRPPVDNDGILIPGIVGYEILRGSRQGNRTIIAKGIINNMVTFDPKTNEPVTGLFQNYPFNDLRGDKFLSKKKSTSGVGGGLLDSESFNANDYSKKLFSFHSPETNFKNPFLNASELKVYQDFSGIASMRYKLPNKQPKQIFIRNLGATLAAIGGVGLGALATKGKKARNLESGFKNANFANMLLVGFTNSATPSPAYIGLAAGTAATNSSIEAAESIVKASGVPTIAEGVAGTMDSTLASVAGAVNWVGMLGSAAPAIYGETNRSTTQSEYGQNDYISFALNTIVNALAGGYPTFVYYLAQGADTIWRAIELASKPRDHTLQSIAHCYYGNWTSRPSGQRRRLIRNQAYIDGQIINFGTDYKVNNLYRNRYVLLELSNGQCVSGAPVLSDQLNGPAVPDETRRDCRLADLNFPDKYRNPEQAFVKNSSTYYAALKTRIRNQYGQLNNIIQIPISTTQAICAPASQGNRGFSIQDGFQIPDILAEGRDSSGLRLPLNCQNNKILNPQFGNGTNIPSFSNWVSVNPNFWQAQTAGGMTFASSGTSLLSPVTGGSSTELYQTFPPLTVGQPYTLSLNLKTLPAGYAVKVYVSSTAISPIATLTAAGTYSLPQIGQPPLLAPVNADRLRFEIDAPVDPVSYTADIDIQVETPSNAQQFCAVIAATIAVPNPWPPPAFITQNVLLQNGPVYLWGSLGISNVTGGIGGPITTGTDWQYQNIDQQGNKENTFYPGTVWDKMRSYISGLNCTSILRWVVDITHDVAPGAQGPCAARHRVTVCRLRPGDPPLYAGDVVAVVWDDNIQQNGAGIATPIGQTPVYIMTGNQQGPSSGTTALGNSGGAGWNTGAGVISSAGAPVTVNNITGQVTITNPDPNDRYYFLIDAAGARVTVSGQITLDLCAGQSPVEITDICLKQDPAPPGPCTDDAAVNYTQTGPCLYAGCMDTAATNYSPIYTYPCNNGVPVLPPGVTNTATLPCVPCIIIPPPSSGGVVPSVVGYGYCNWPCLPEFSTPNSVRSYRSPVLFGGDIYIGRYTEKNTFFYFFDWLYGQPDIQEWDYYKYRMIPYPTYWFHAEGFSMLECVLSVWDFLTNPGQWFANSTSWSNNVIQPSDFYVLDKPDDSTSPNIAIKRGYIYLFNSGVRDFFVESEYNVDYRDFGELVEERHYMPYGKYAYWGLTDMFEPSIIKRGNYYKYDDSLSIARIWYSYVGWGQLYPTYYNPNVAETCYQYRPDRIIYSLPVQKANVRDNWRIYLTNNYKDFLSRVIAVKQINKSGALILFESDSPVMFQGTDQLQTDLGTKLTIGDGGLFSQPMQNIVNSERSFEYGSSTSRLSIINTPVGAYWISQNQGKIFSLSSGLDELSMQNLKWWLSQFLPYQLVKYFPNYVLKDNPVVGIGCQTVYDNTNNLVYFTKKDYKPVLDEDGNPFVSYDETINKFYIILPGSVRIRTYIELTDPVYFEPASWTISFDVKTKAWLSFHDWHPDLAYSDKNTFMTTKVNGIWQHNKRCDLYTTYYGVSYPFEVEYMVNTGQNVNTLRSIEYQLEVYQYMVDNCYDRYHVLDYNFDEVVIYNTEQCSGLLKLKISPKNNPLEIVNYPKVTPVAVGTSGQIEILYSKEENKYRFNQFWDTTYDRGEFPYSNLGSVGQYPPVPSTALTGGDWATSGLGNWRERNIWDTEPNGYVKILNNNNLNYSKAQLERKRFRHYTMSVFLRRKKGDGRKMLVSLVNNKNLASPR